MGFIDSGWTVTGDTIHIPEHIDPWIGYKFVQEAVYDGHLPVTKVIGYHLTTGTKAQSVRSSRLIERDRNCIDDRLTTASNMSKMIVLNNTAPRMHSSDQAGRLTVSGTKFTYSQKEITVLSTEDYILTALEPIMLELVLSTSTGYHDANDNFTKLMESKVRTSKTRYFPLFSMHSVLGFAYVLPFTGRDIKIRFKHGLDMIQLLSMFEMLFETTPDKSWCNNYQEVLR